METRGYVCVCGCKLHQDQYWILVENPFFVVIHTIAVSSECMYTNSQVLFSRKKTHAQVQWYGNPLMRCILK